MWMKVLIVEDDVDINRLICRYLEKEHYQTVAAFSGTEARLQLSLNNFDLILLDLMLPGLTGEDLVLEMKGTVSTPIIVVSAKSALEDRVKLLKSGADDYITKPFQLEELLARVEAVLRRSNKLVAEPKDRDLSFKELVLKESSREAYVKGNSLSLTAHEFDILKLLLQNPERVFTKEQVFQEIWRSGYYGEDNTINVHISNIRKKIKEFDEDSYIKTVWGIGFKLDTIS
jgi:DNA-binding response OmpR family regulator